MQIFQIGIPYVKTKCLQLLSPICVQIFKFDVTKAIRKKMFVGIAAWRFLDLGGREGIFFRTWILTN